MQAKRGVRSEGWVRTGRYCVVLFPGKRPRRCNEAIEQGGTVSDEIERLSVRPIALW